jgi:hypothetical protein
LQASCLHLPSTLKVSHNQHKNCFSSYTIACLSSYDDSSCEIGIEEAKKNSNCHINLNDVSKVNLNDDKIF